MKKIEIFKDIKGYEGRYQISNFGRVKSLLSNKELKIQFHKNGYGFVSLLSSEGNYKPCFIHALVAEAFIGERKSNEVVDHMDRNKQNNAVWNLRIISRSENSKNADCRPKGITKELQKQYWAIIDEMIASGEKEIWKDIVGYEGLYQVSSFGRVKSVKRDLCLSPSVKKDTHYCAVDLRKDSKRKTFLIHRLVAMTFLNNEEGKAEVDHINENQLDNSLRNVRWATRSENLKNRSCFKK